MAKQQWLRAVAERIKARTVGWCWFHSVLDYLVDRAVSVVWRFAVWACIGVAVFLESLGMSWWSIFLFVVASLGMIVTGIPLVKELRGSASSTSKRDRRANELLREAEEITDGEAAEVWKSGVAGFLYYLEHDKVMEVDNIDVRLSDFIDEERPVDKSGVDRIANILKNVVAVT